MLDSNELPLYKLDPEDLVAYTFDNPGINARLGLFQNNYDPLDGTMLERFIVYVCYVLQPADGSLIKAVLNSELNLVSDIEVNDFPYVIGSAMPVPHRVPGISLFEVLENVQIGKTEILRQYLDNLGVANLGRIGAVEGQVNMTDLTNGRVNGVVRTRSANALFPIPTTDVGPSALQGLAYMDQVASDKVGAAMDFNSVQAQLMGTSATAANAVASTVEKMTGWYAANIVETVLKPVFLKMGELLGVRRTKVKVNMGLTTIQKAERVQGLTTILALQEKVMLSGGKDILVTLSNTFNAVGDYCRAMDLGDVAQYFTDPRTPESQQAQQFADQQGEQNKQEAIQFELAKIRASAEAQRSVQADKLTFEAQKLVTETQFDYAKLNQDGEIAEAQLTVEVVTKDAGAHKAEDLT
jgi:hypothetical protein